MNRTEVIMTIKAAGTEFSRIMACLHNEDHVAGYIHALNDMVRLFEQANIARDFDAEREAMIAKIKELKAKNAELEQEVCEKHATIQKLLSHVNISEVLGVNIKKQEDQKAQRRGVAFIFK